MPRHDGGHSGWGVADERRELQTAVRIAERRRGAAGGHVRRRGEAGRLPVPRRQRRPTKRSSTSRGRTGSAAGCRSSSVRTAPPSSCWGGSRSSGEAARAEMYIEELKKYFKVSAFPSNRGTVTAVLSDVTERKRAQDELQVAEESLVAELAAMTRLHAIATRFVREGDLPALLEEVVDAAVSIVGADMASIQLRDPVSGELKLTAQRGFGPAVVDHFASVRPDAESSDREAMRAAGVLAIQTTPLGSRSGKVVGLLSTYFRRVHRLPSHSLKLLELLALQCADAIERARWAEEAATLNARAEYAQKLRESEERFRTTVENIPINLVLYDREFRLLYLNPALSLQCSVKLKIPKEELDREVRRGAVARGGLGAPAQARRARHPDGRTADVRAGQRPAGTATLRSSMDHRSAVRVGRPGGPAPGDERGHHRAAAAGRRAARGGSPQERVHRGSLARAAQSAGGDSHHPLRPRAWDAREPGGRQGAGGDRPPGRSRRSNGGRSPRRDPHLAEQGRAPETPARSAVRSFARRSRTTAPTSSSAACGWRSGCRRRRSWSAPTARGSPR